MNIDEHLHDTGHHFEYENTQVINWKENSFWTMGDKACNFK